MGKTGTRGTGAKELVAVETTMRRERMRNGRGNDMEDANSWLLSKRERKRGFDYCCSPNLFILLFIFIFSFPQREEA